MSTKVALVTGASQGIGRAVALRLAQDKCRIALADIPSQKNDLDDLKSEIIEAGGEAAVYVADVSAEMDVHEMIEDVVLDFGSLDILVFNAENCPQSSFLGASHGATQLPGGRLFSVNISGALLCYKFAAIQMVQQGRVGRIIGAASGYQKQGDVFTSAYSLTNSAMRGLTQAAADELQAHGITVNAYTSVISSPPTWSEIRRASMESFMKEAKSLGQEIDISEIAGLVSYLASDQGASITGQTACVSISNGLLHF